MKTTTLKYKTIQLRIEGRTNGIGFQEFETCEIYLMDSNVNIIDLFTEEDLEIIDDEISNRWS